MPSEGELRRHALAALCGRSLLAEELAAALHERGIPAARGLDQSLDPWVHEGAIERLAAVGWDGTWRCRRCRGGAVHLLPCYRCGSEACPHCETCASLGAATACTPLYRSCCEAGSGPDEGEPLVPNLPFELTPYQRRIARRLVAGVRDALIWASCGAGKTETVLDVIGDVIGRGGRVLFAVPRRDAALQLGERIAGAFPLVECATLVGGSPLRYPDVRLIVATVHQALRFYRSFDLVIVDEVDAFPLNREPWLLAALDGARRPGARIIMMSATPPLRLRVRMEGGEIDHFTLPARPHGRPLPVPQVLLCSEGGKDRPTQREAIVSFVREGLAKKRRAFLFVPFVRTLGTVMAALQSDPVCRAARFASVHANDPKRGEKLALMEAGELDGLVTTSILERGVTFARLDVLVVAADCERVFDEGALIQMAGRAGRRPEDPSGRVVFLADRLVLTMERAIEAIRRLNEEAASLGLIAGETAG